MLTFRRTLLPCLYRIRAHQADARSAAGASLMAPLMNTLTYARPATSASHDPAYSVCRTPELYHFCHATPRAAGCAAHGISSTPFLPPRAYSLRLLLPAASLGVAVLFHLGLLAPTGKRIIRPWTTCARAPVCLASRLKRSLITLKRRERINKRFALQLPTAQSGPARDCRAWRRLFRCMAFLPTHAGGQRVACMGGKMDISAVPLAPSPFLYSCFRAGATYRRCTTPPTPLTPLLTFYGSSMPCAAHIISV